VLRRGVHGKDRGFVGISSAANVVAAFDIARELDDGVVVTILPDNGFKYVSDRFWIS
jgi:cysteine synthase B